MVKCPALNLCTWVVDCQGGCIGCRRMPHKWPNMALKSSSHACLIRCIQIKDSSEARKAAQTHLHHCRVGLPIQTLDPAVVSGQHHLRNANHLPREVIIQAAQDLPVSTAQTRRKAFAKAARSTSRHKLPLLWASCNGLRGSSLPGSKPSALATRGPSGSPGPWPSAHTWTWLKSSNSWPGDHSLLDVPWKRSSMLQQPPPAEGWQL